MPMLHEAWEREKPNFHSLSCWASLHGATAQTQPASGQDPLPQEEDALGQLFAPLPKEGHTWCPDLVVPCAEDLNQQRLIRPSALHRLPKLSGLVLAGQVQQSQHSLFEMPTQLSLQDLFQILQR